MSPNSSEIENYLADCWCEINGGGVVTEDQTKAMEEVKRMYQKYTYRAEVSYTDPTGCELNESHWVTQSEVAKILNILGVGAIECDHVEIIPIDSETKKPIRKDDLPLVEA